MQDSKKCIHYRLLTRSNGKKLVTDNAVNVTKDETKVKRTPKPTAYDCSAHLIHFLAKVAKCLGNKVIDTAKYFHNYSAAFVRNMSLDKHYN